MEDESINLISNDYERKRLNFRTEHRRQIEDPYGTNSAPKKPQQDGTGSD